MTLKEYGIVTTGLLGAVFGFDILWTFTSMEALKSAFGALLFGLFASLVFGIGMELLEDRRNSKRRNRATYITDDETGLMYMPMKNGRGV